MKFKKILPQFLTLLFIVLIFGFFTMNAQENMDTRGIQFGFGFLSKEASFDIQFSLIDYDGSMSYGRAYLVGLLNTLLVSFIGIILCTILGSAQRPCRRDLSCYTHYPCRTLWYRRARWSPPPA